MNTRTSLILVALVSAGALAVAGCADNGSAWCPFNNQSAPVPAHHVDTMPPLEKDIVDTAVSAGSFNTLVAAVKAAGLVETLKAPGPYTVFAPTDDAFAKLPEGTLESLLANPDKLKAILLYHVTPGKVMAADVVKLDRAPTAGGATIPVKVQGGQVYAGPARVVKTDIPASNGVIHVIDTVLIPPSK